MAAATSTAAPTIRGEDYVQRVLGEKRRHRAALAEPRTWQRRVLAELLAENAASEFGAAHRFARISDPDRFREEVPIRTHEEFAPWLQRAIEGRSGVLTADDPVVYFSSSGTTGAEKHIPVTPTYMRRCFLPFYFALVAPILEHHPAILAGGEAAILNLWQDPYSPTQTTAGGQPHIGPSQVDYHRFGEPMAVGLGNRAPWSRLPDELAGADPWERAYLRLRVAAEYDVRCVVAVNPAIVAALPWQLDRWWPRIVDELRAGTVGGIPMRSPDPDRAAEIEHVARRLGTIRPGDLWPRLELIVSWNTALASLYLPRVRQEFGPKARVRPAPIASCEGPVGLPLDEHSTAGPLLVSTCFYEFIPADRDIAPDGATLLADEIEPGGEYHVVLSHIGGLYRCAVRDIVRVVDFAERTPRVEYAGRSLTLSAAGERLREPHVVRALRAALDDLGLELVNATARIDPVARAPRYEVAVEPHGASLREGPKRRAELARALDVHLGRQSAGYLAARSGGRLGPVRVIVTSPNAFVRDWERRVRSGERPPRVKDRVFQPDPAAWTRIVAQSTGGGDEG